MIRMRANTVLFRSTVHSDRKYEAYKLGHTYVNKHIYSLIGLHLAVRCLKWLYFTHLP